MKIKNLFAILLALTLLICTFVIPTSAKESTKNNTAVEIIINNEVSEETKEKIERYFATGEPATDTGASTYGLTCTLFGHKIEGTIVTAVTHKVRATSPRCKKDTYNYEACTRCDYETSQLIDTEYIVCCS
ncbi:MAG: hypothetical protein E7522_04480 [Ruminococcaceae bacterium]|nr:hypothetical protein [Oscillospiraceae bacterium]